MGVLFSKPPKLPIPKGVVICGTVGMCNAAVLRGKFGEATLLSLFGECGIQAAEETKEIQSSGVSETVKPTFLSVRGRRANLGFYRQTY